MEDFTALQEDMVYPTEPKLDGDFCGLTSINESILSTIAGTNLSIMDGEQQWDVLVKQREFCKAKSYNVVAWAFFTSSSFYSLEVNSSTPQFE
jgi:hypothetical protein